MTDKTEAVVQPACELEPCKGWELCIDGCKQAGKCLRARQAAPAQGAPDIDRMKIGLDAVARQIQSWLDWHKKHREDNDPPLVTDDGTHIMCLPVPYWPNHGAFQNWISLFRECSEALSSRSPADYVRGLEDAAISECKAWAERNSRSPADSDCDCPVDESKACDLLRQQVAKLRDQVERCRDMLDDVPGDGLEEKLTKLVGDYLALQIMLSESRDLVESATAWLDQEITRAADQQRQSYAMSGEHGQRQGERWHARQIALYEAKLKLTSTELQK
jgi:hypothetical protein